ncbi:MAG TPA: DUF3455 domain-containing protein [Xanthobacteraceae bacterium]|nr:DUF3455 domain-containing protein [Xanthobacteraceae bacterium]
MFKHVPHALAALLLLSEFAMAEDIPAKLVPPAGTTLIGKYAAKGVQIYACAAKGAGNEWTFKAPEAVLTGADGKTLKHYAGPTWEAPDGSKIVGKAIANDPAPQPGNIPWLLLSVESSGTGLLAGARFVQRVNTKGGVGPIGVCATAGVEQRVDYTADYLIYK